MRPVGVGTFHGAGEWPLGAAPFGERRRPADQSLGCEHVRIVVVGATGLIGAAVTARLLAEGHELVAIGRRVGIERDRLRWVAADMRALQRADDWVVHLREADAVVNCAGVLQDSGHDSTAAVHWRGPAALFAACARAAIKRVVHVSAIGVDREAPTAFSRTKAQGDAVLMASGLDWVVLRPSVVVGRAAYGGSALFRGLAALPVLPRILSRCRSGYSRRYTGSATLPAGSVGDPRCAARCAARLPGARSATRGRGARRRGLSRRRWRTPWPPNQQLCRSGGSLGCIC